MTKNDKIILQYIINNKGKCTSFINTNIDFTCRECPIGNGSASCPHYKRVNAADWDARCYEAAVKKLKEHFVEEILLGD